MRYSLYDLPLLALWLGWLFCWLVASWYVKPTRRKESSATRLLTIALTLPAAVLLAVPESWLPDSWRHVLGARFLPDTMIVYWLGLLIVIAGLAFAIWARVYLGRNWSGTVTVKENHELIRSGPYAIVRHPIYTGLIAGMLATGIAVGTVTAILGAILISLGMWQKGRMEEVFLSKELGEDAYGAYCRRVPMIIPFLSPR